MNDPRPKLIQAVDQAQRLAETVGPDDLTKPTPCPEFDVRTLLGHLLTVLSRIEVALAGGDVLAIPQVTEGVDDLPAAWKERRSKLDATLAEPDVLDRMCTLPWGTHPSSFAIAAYTSELTTHAWDLAVALDRTDLLDDELALYSLPLAHQFLPAEPRGGPIPFGPVVPVPDDAPPYTRLAAWQGRRS